jgi:hypothetical protein
MCFLWFSEHQPLFPFNGLVSITQIDSVYCAVRTEYLNIFQVKSFFEFSRAMDQEISRRLALDRPGFGPRSDRVSFVVSKVAKGTGFPPNTTVFACHKHSMNSLDSSKQNYFNARYITSMHIILITF